MKIYKLTGEGRKRVKIPAQQREEILDHLYENKTATRDELLAIDKDASRKLRQFSKEHLIMEVI